MLRLLAQLTVVGDVTRDAFAARVREMAAGPEHVTVIEGARPRTPHALFMFHIPCPKRCLSAALTRFSACLDAATGAVLACGTLLVERKLIRSAGCAGHVEDVVVDADARGRGVGKALLDALVAKAKALGCYKARIGQRAWLHACWALTLLYRQVILDCSEENQAFYSKCGFKRKEVQMALYL